MSVRYLSSVALLYTTKTSPRPLVEVLRQDEGFKESPWSILLVMDSKMYDIIRRVVLVSPTCLYFKLVDQPLVCHKPLKTDEDVEDQIAPKDQAVKTPFKCNADDYAHSTYKNLEDLKDIVDIEVEGGRFIHEENDSEDDIVDPKFKAKKNILYASFDPSTPWNQCNPVLGMKFENTLQLKNMLANYGAANRYQLWNRYALSSLMDMAYRMSELVSSNVFRESFTCNTSLEIFHREFNRMSRMDNDLFTYEVEIPGLASVPCDLNDEDDSKQQMTHGSDVDMEYDPSNTKGDDEVELTDEESSDSDDDDDDEVAEIFRIDTNIYEWNEDVPWVHEKPWTDTGIWEEPTLVKHYCEPFNYKNGCSEWPTCKWKDDGYCNGRNLPGAYIVGNTLRYQNIEWYEALEDGKLKDEALKNKAIIIGMIDKDDESHNEGWRRWDGYVNTIHDHKERENEEEHENEERCELFDNPRQETPVCKIRRFEMIKYSFGQDEEYMAIKECKYDDLTITNEDACLAYQEIFRSMDEGWMVTRAE
ncbi:hypothetical protein Tco_0159245 [Tanacetum coccineum]